MNSPACLHAWVTERRGGRPVLACQLCDRVMSERECREIVAARSGGVCEICGERPVQSMHHRLTRKFGPWSPANIVALCGDGVAGCHGRVTNTRTQYYDDGWLIHSWDLRTPDEIPFLHWQWGAVCLDNAGDYHQRKDAA
ncbi:MULTISPECIES: hypothetical protein [Actinomycetes]|uniref:hypothetical protein n=1 Tax=Actinomycetes TaxID=1760 RepID=UPI0001B55022|nr:MULTISPECIES: hypothetical protein [Actinomycetes]